ncbi:acyl carrier protein [Photorhabdus sp. P32]|uniref:acyl carrier protein n=1 Tax=Photorhabdus sp. P32 TaxID=3117549 RepID=UPI00311B1775
MQINSNMNQLEIVARERLAASLTIPITAQAISLQENMSDAYGLTSLNKVLFITSLCNKMEIDLSRFTEDDLENMRTLGNVIDILSAHAAT